MKKKNLFVLLAFAFGLTFVSCGDVDTESCDSEDVSGDYSCPTDVNAVATFCSDGVNNSYYTYNGTKYECSGVEASTCDAALEKISAALIADGCSTKKSGSVEIANYKLSAMAEDLISQVRSKSLCE